MRSDELSTVAGNVFVVSDSLGNVLPGESQGLFAADTRYLSRFELQIAKADVVKLRAGSTERGRSEVYATNSGRGNLPPHSLEIYRRRELNAEFNERIELTNRGDEPLSIPVSIVCDADYADIFEVRAGPKPDSTRRFVSYVLAGMNFQDPRRRRERQTHVRFNPLPASVSRGTARYSITIEPRETWCVDVRVRWLVPDPETTHPVPIPVPADEDALASDWLAHVPELDTDDPQLDLAYRQAVKDIATLEFALDSGHPIPAAGLPWYLAIFGRDSILTSYQCLVTGCRQAHGTLRTLGAYQSTEDSAFRDAEPGKMPHEVRFGELAVSGAIPHARYYGTVDATPLWMVLLHEAISWSWNVAIIDELLHHAEMALAWIDDFGDLDGDGLIEYHRRSEHGLENQGWKDSWDSIRFADGQLARGPIALVEVQGYVFAAKQAMASIYEIRGNQERAERLRAEAKAMKKLIHDAFWMPEHGYYALALDSQKRQVDSITSNPGHLLWCGAVDEPHARQIAERIDSPEMFSGWGVRTMASDMGAYNPFSYHNGSVWPHDNSLIAAGLARYGMSEIAMKLIEGLLDATIHFEQTRLPELFCGYPRSRTSFPVDYPVACSPQAWAAGSIILMLQTMSGISAKVDHLHVDPLPHGRRLTIDGVRFRGESLRLRCEPDNVSVTPATTSSQAKAMIG